jgi:hypothetical protein
VLVIEAGNPPAWQEFPWEGPAGRTSGSIVHHLAIDDHLPVAMHLETGEFPQARRQRLSETVTAWLPPVAEAPPSVKPLPPLPPGPVEPLDKALADLRAGHLAGAEALVRMPVVGERRAEVVEALTTALQATDGAQAVAATQALVVWGGKLAVPALVARLRRLHDNQFVLRGALIEALGAIRDPRAAEVIARWLPRDRARAAQALKALGRDAEEEVFPLLKHPDPQVREEACGILAVIGTAVAYPKLDELIFGDSYRTVKHAANKAQEAIVKRDPRAKPPPIRIIQ